jgi:hypothetical protein
MSYTPALVSNVETLTVNEYVQQLNRKKINPDPLSQRPPVSTGFGKSKAIIESVMMGINPGIFTLRDISNDDLAQQQYKNQDKLVIDGGHRSRALRDYYAGRFFINEDVYYTDLSDDQMDYLDNVELLFVSYTCTAAQAQDIFLRVNTTTPVNEMEMIMSNDTSGAAEQIRHQVSFYREYDNLPHALFDTKKVKDNLKSEHWSMDINPRRLWDEFAAITFLKAIGGGHVEAGYGAIREWVNNGNPASPDQVKTVEKILNDMLNIKKAQYHKLNKDTWSAIQTVLFALYEKSKSYKIDDVKSFTAALFSAHARLTGKTENSYDTDMRKFATGYSDASGLVYSNEPQSVKQFARRAIKNYANKYQQQAVAELYLEEMKDAIEEYVILRDDKRSLTKNERQEMLALQNFKCAIDNQPLDWEESVYGHDTPWCKGGNSTWLNGKMIRSSHNRDMGAMTIDEYKVLLAAQGKLAAE